MTGSIRLAKAASAAGDGIFAGEQQEFWSSRGR